jgi:predicted transposase/invertase (TIGR01784 family)
MKIDKFFDRFFRQFPSAFFSLIGEDKLKAGKYKFTAVEVKEQAFRFDGIFIPKTKDDDIYFVEAQFSKRRDFYLRLFAEIAVYLRQKKPNNHWRAVVIFPTPGIDPGFDHHYQEFFESGRLLRVYLNQLPKKHLEKFPLNLFRIILDSEQDAVLTGKKIIRQLPIQIRSLRKQKEVIDLLMNLLSSKLPQLSQKEVKKMFEPILTDVKKSRFYQEIAREITQESSLKEKHRIAKALLKKKMSLEFITEVTGLSSKEVRALNKTLASRRN